MIAHLKPGDLVYFTREAAQTRGIVQRRRGDGTWWVRWDTGATTPHSPSALTLVESAKATTYDGNPVTSVTIDGQTYGLGDEVALERRGVVERAVIIRIGKNPFALWPNNTLFSVRFVGDGTTKYIYANQIIRLVNKTIRVTRKEPEMTTKDSINRTISELEAALVKAKADLKALDIPKCPGTGSYSYEVQFAQHGKAYTYLVQITPATSSEDGDFRVYTTGREGYTSWEGFVRDVRSLENGPTAMTDKPWAVSALVPLTRNMARRGVVMVES